MKSGSSGVTGTGISSRTRGGGVYTPVGCLTETELAVYGDGDINLLDDDSDNDGTLDGEEAFKGSVSRTDAYDEFSAPLIDGNGLWGFDGTGWSKLSSWNAEEVEGCACGLAADFGANRLWLQNGTAWSKLSNWNPEDLSAHGSGLAGDFGADGLWHYDCTSTWGKMTSWNPESMTDVDLE
jgi:hypothetical protein